MSSPETHVLCEQSNQSPLNLAVLLEALLDQKVDRGAGKGDAFEASKWFRAFLHKGHHHAVSRATQGIGELGRRDVDQLAEQALQLLIFLFLLFHGSEVAGRYEANDCRQLLRFQIDNHAVLVPRTSQGSIPIESRKLPDRSSIIGSCGDSNSPFECFLRSKVFETVSPWKHEKPAALENARCLTHNFARFQTFSGSAISQKK